MKITEDNWNKLFPNASMRFKTFINGSYCPQRYMAEPDSYRQIRYILPEDVVDVLNKRLKSQANKDIPRAQKDAKIWNNMIEAAKKLINTN